MQKRGLDGGNWFAPEGKRPKKKTEIISQSSLTYNQILNILTQRHQESHLKQNQKVPSTKKQGY